jgi:serine/threonine-protein kinase
MAYAHARGVIHRDLKPSNIMVGGFGEVQVMDWGLAKVLVRGEEAPRSDEPSEPDLTVVATARSGPAGSDPSRAGTVLGTPTYMAPEQARGEIHRVDARADVFALGAILCEVLAGRPPYVGRSPAEVQRKAARGDLAEALAAIDACGADPELIAIARDCLAAEPEDRPGDARAVADRIGGYLAGVSRRLKDAELQRAAEAARAEEAETAAVAERRARRLTVGLTAAVLLLIGLAGGGYAWLESDRSARRAATERAVATELDRARALRAEALAAPPDQPGPWDAALAVARGAEARLRQGESDQALRRRVALAIDEIERGQREARDRADRLAADRKLLAELESIRGTRADHGDPKLTDRAYATAFRDAGLDLDTADPERAGAWIAARSAPLELASFLDDWARVRGQAKTGDEAVGRLVAAARAADKDPWRDALRAGSGAKGPAALEALGKLAADEQALGSQPAEGLRLLALRLMAAGDSEGAVRILRRAWRLRPDDFWVHFDLARALAYDLTRSLAAGSEAAAQKYPLAEEAVRHLTAALAVRPRSAMAHTSLGIALHAQGKLDEAITEYLEAIRLRPDYALAHCNLGQALKQQGRFREALDELRKGHELASNWPEWRRLAADGMRQAERLVALEARLPAVIRGEDKPRDGAEGVALADVAYKLQRHSLSARLYAEAFRADPKPAEDMIPGHRYNAACAAALAGYGQGKDDPPPGEAARAELRQQALDWLKADLAARGRMLDAGDPKARAYVAWTLQHWKKDNDLAGVRDPAALARLPEAERKPWQALWADVDALLARAQGGQP